MRNKKLLAGHAKVLSAVLAAAVAMSGTACGKNASSRSSASGITASSSMDDAGTASTENEEALAGAIDSVVPSHASESGKEETVYVIADASGNTQNVIVSNWLKNKDGASTITDRTNLKDIQNVDGDETYTENKDGTITWKADGNDIYYQGTTDQKLPVDVKISYTLDGKSISPEDLAGKSGRVTIRFDYTNNETKTVKIDGKEQKIKVPFGMVSGVILPNENFSNIQVTNGKVISDGQNNIVVGAAFPSLRESLDIDALKEDTSSEDVKKKLEDLDIPEYVEITADAENFKLDTTMTAAVANLLNMVTLSDDQKDDSKVDTGKIRSDMDDLQDGSDKLVDGTSDLADGASDLKDGAGKLKDGGKTLKDGTSDLKDGASDLKDGAGDLRNGASDLKDGTGKLKNGASDLADGTDDLKDGTGKLAGGTDDLKSGTDTLKSGSAELARGTDDLKSGADKLADGSSKLKDGTAAAVSGIQKLKSGSKQLADGANDAASGSQQLYVRGTQQLKDKTKDLPDSAKAGRRWLSVR